MTFFLALAMAYLRIKRSRQMQQERVSLAHWQILLQNLPRAAADLPNLAMHDRVYFLKLWNNLMRSASADAARNLIDIAYWLECDHFSCQLLQHGNRAERLLATLTLGQLHDHPPWELLVTHTLATDSITSIYAFDALVQIDAEAAAQQLLPLLLARKDWPLAHVAAILQPAHHAFFLPLLEATADIKSVYLGRTLRLLEALRLNVPQAILLRLLEPSNETATILAALRLINDSSLLPSARNYLHHADWHVRVQAAKALGRLGEHADANRLISLLSDPEWWVRYRAAQALVGMPFFSRIEVELLRNHLSDRFARDMLNQVLAERQSI